MNFDDVDLAIIGIVLIAGATIFMLKDSQIIIACVATIAALARGKNNG